ncbi:hypothetical protein EB118_25955, partial [bacterium]|nr:hypothetical protein [bacterium]
DGDGNPRVFYDADGAANPVVAAGKPFVKSYTGNSGSYAASTTVDFAAMSGIIIANNWSIGGIGVFIVGGGSVTLVSSASSGYGTIAFTGSVYRWTSDSGGTYTYSLTAISTRPAV